MSSEPMSSEPMNGEPIKAGPGRASPIDPATAEAGPPSIDHAGLSAHVGLRRGGFELDVRLQIGSGETAALLGPNGAGKSTLVAALAGLLPLADGHVTLAGRVLDDPVGGVFVPPERRRIGVVFQDQMLFGHLSAVDNVAFGLRARGMRRAQARRHAQRWLDAMDLSDLASRRPRALSGGQRQRVALARALACDPDLLLADEPLGSLDVTARNRLRRSLAAHLSHERDGSNGGGGADPARRAQLPLLRAAPRLLITHDSADAFVLADRLHIIEKGRVTQSGTPEQLRRSPATAYAAELSGVNLVRGIARSGEVAVAAAGPSGTADCSPQSNVVLHAADTSANGPVLATIGPRAIALHRERPSGSPRNVWHTTAEAVEPLGDITRVLLGAPLRFSADITPAAAHELAIRPGASLWASVKATEVALSPEEREQLKQ